MKIIKNISEITQIVSDFHKNKKQINLIPTMGNIHAGHLSLLTEAKKFDGINIVSIFVNPAQFNEENDFTNYPKTFDTDVDILAKAHCEIIFAPSIKEIYPRGANSKKTVFKYRDILCDISRSGHFDGVTTIVKILFDLIKPCRVFFGEKDFQQIIIIKQIINSYFPKITLITCPTVRNNDGLALSSRNKLISKKAINKSGIIFETLLFVKNNFIKTSYKQLIKNVKQKIEDISNFKLEYFEIRESETLNPYDEKNKKKSYRAFICVKVEGIRLIDNLLIN